MTPEQQARILLIPRLIGRKKATVARLEDKKQGFLDQIEQLETELAELKAL